jgi:prepilin-type N-terminal cleavage/methylation domain-containing protein
MKGFSLVELMVAVTIVTVVTGGAMVAATRFGDNQKLSQARDQLVSTLRLARNYAKTAQVPELGAFKYVEVSIGTDGVVRAAAQPGDEELLERDVTNPEIGLTTLDSESVKFSPYLGKLLSEVSGNVSPKGSDYNYRITLHAKSNVGDTLTINISAGGIIDGR